jgi:hypothetical protein
MAVSVVLYSYGFDTICDTPATLGLAVVTLGSYL